jgi:prepilin-type N-terminal cleavage/methylation domain-containing protein
MPRKKGLTLVELLVSLAIAAILVVAALGASASIARAHLKVHQDDVRPERLQDALQTIVGMDLLHGHHYRDAVDGFSVQTYASLATGTLRLEHVPAVATYRIRKVGERTHLVRVQETAGQVLQMELVAADVRSVRLVPAKPVNPGPDGWKPLVGPCVVQVEFASGIVEVKDLERGQT